MGDRLGGVRGGGMDNNWEFELEETISNSSYGRFIHFGANAIGHESTSSSPDMAYLIGLVSKNDYFLKKKNKLKNSYNLKMDLNNLFLNSQGKV